MEQHLRAEVMSAIETECVNIGFKKRASIYFTSEFTPDTIGLLAFVFGKDGDMLVSPSVAVRYQPLERVLAELTGEKFHPYLSGTLACPLCHVPPRDELLWFEFPERVDAPHRVREMVSIIAETAVPWMERHQDLDSFIKDLQIYRFANRDQVRLRLPVAYYLMNEDELARSLVMKGLEEIGDDSDPLSTQYRKFAKALLARLLTGPPACS